MQKQPSTMIEPEMSSPTKGLLFACASGLFLGIFDISLKQALTDFFVSQPEPIILIPNLLNFHLEKNTALAFSIQIPFQLILFLNATILILLAVFLAKKLNFSKKLAIFTYTILLAGAFSNLYERLTLGYVTDFIAFATFPVFNLADSFITISVFLLILFYDRITRPF